MHDADALEAINHEQLVTATDRLLLRGGVRGRDLVALLGPARLAEGSSPFIVPARLAGGSSPFVVPAAVRGHAPLACSRLARGSSAACYADQAPAAGSPIAQRQAGSAPAARRLVGRAPIAGPRATRAYASPAPSARTLTVRAVPSLVASPRARAAADQTVFVRAVRPRAFPVTVVIAMLLGILVGLVAML